jgi:hypothetical protein
VFTVVALRALIGAMPTFVIVGDAVATPSVLPPAFVAAMALLFVCVIGPTVVRIGVAAALLAAAAAVVKPVLTAGA